MRHAPAAPLLRGHQLDRVLPLLLRAAPRSPRPLASIARASRPNKLHLPVRRDANPRRTEAQMRHRRRHPLLVGRPVRPRELARDPATDVPDGRVPEPKPTLLERLAHPLQALAGRDPCGGDPGDARRRHRARPQVLRPGNRNRPMSGT